MATNENVDDVPPAGGGDLPVPDLRTMEELCQSTLNGRGGPIAPIAIQATNFRLKNDMIQQVQNSCQFHGLLGDDANKNLDKFLHVSQSIKVNGVTDDALHLYLFPHSLTHHATAWFERLPRSYITTFEQMAKMFLEKYFPPSMVTKLRNEITNFRQRPDESLFKAWERYKLSIDRYPNHNMLPVTQIDTFYNGLTLRHRDTINVVADGTFMKRRPEECYDLIENMIAHHNDWDTSAQRSESSSSITSSYPKIIPLKTEMAEINKNLMKVLQINQQVKAVTHSCETCGGPHCYNDCPATVGQSQNIYAARVYNQGGNSYQPQENHNFLSYRSDNYLGPPGFNQNQNRSNPNQNYQNRNQGNNNGNVQGNNQRRNQFFQGASHGQNLHPAYQASTYQAPEYVWSIHENEYRFILGFGNTLSNTITNSKEDLKGITTRSGISYKGPTIPTTSSPPKVVECETEVIKDMIPPTNNESTKDVQPSVVQIKTQIPNFELVVAPVVKPVEAPVSALKPNPKPSIPYPSRLHDQKLRDKTNDQKEKFFQIFQDFNFNISIADALILMPKFRPTIKSLLTNKEKLFELARTPLNELLGGPPQKTGRALIDVYEGELTLRVGNKAVTFNLDQTTRYSSNYGDMSVNQIDVIDVACEEYSQEILGFSVSGYPTPSTEPIVYTSSPTLTPFEDSDFLLEETNAFLAIKDEPISLEIDDSFYDSEGDILLFEEFLNDDPSSPPLPPQELKGDDKLPVIIAKDLKDGEKTALIKVLKSHKQTLAWQLFDIKGINQEFYTHKIIIEDDFKPAVQHQRKVNPKIHEVIKKENEENELIPTRLVTGWRVCIDYQKLNDATRKDHFPLPFMNQMLEKLAGNKYYCFLDGFSGYFQIPINTQDQEKTTFTCPYRTFAYRRMPFGLCNRPGTFQRCMMAIFYDMIKKMMEVFMDDFSVFVNSFKTCLSHLDKMLKRCEDTNLCLNWEKSHFMVKEGIVLGHKISKNGIEVDEAKVDVITKLPHPTTIKGIRSFLGHAGFYRRFIQDFSKIARPMTRLLEKDTPFFFSKKCIESFQTLKKKLTEAPILVAPDWDLPFELMCDASDFAIGAVLGQRKTKRFQPIHYASKTMTDAQAHYTTTEKELLAVVYAFEKFWPYLILSKSIVYTDHSALKYLFNKQDAKPRLLQ
nr:reverse transcriptase domain-containing protein [Tanacetum cinerariifolium]